MTSRKAKAPTALASGDALENVPSWPASDTREVAPTPLDLQVIYMRRRACVARSLVPTLAALAFGGGLA